LTDEVPLEPEIVGGLKTIADVFNHFKPKVSVEFEREDGQVKEEEILFQSLSDFKPNGINKQSEFLESLGLEEDFLEDMIKQIKSNKTLRSLMQNEDSSKAFIEALGGLLKEMGD
jgi:predicted component of type VI protein secretion system